MNNLEEFDEIRPYHDEELPQVYEELIADVDFQKVAAAMMPDIPFELIARQMRACKTKLEFQKTFCYALMWKIVEKHTKGISLNHERVPIEQACTYLSNHRDIILDSGFLSVLLVEKGQSTVEIAIGDNLLIYPWIKKFVRINKSFIVQRALSMRAMLESSARMSRYIHHTLVDKAQSVWIAQREGRAKDSDDRTQESVLKMLAIGGEGSLVEKLKELNIVPLAISYEYDPCDYLKAAEFQLKRDVEGYKKTMKDDLDNMRIGLFGEKGRVHFQTGKPLNTFIDQLPADLPKTSFFTEVAQYIDREIHANYRIYPGNYVAYDLLHGEQIHASSYTTEEKKGFEQYLAGQIAKIDIANKDEAFLREKLLQMYANPLNNHLAVTR